MSAVSKRKRDFIERGWNAASIPPHQPGVYRVVHAGYRKWDGQQWFQGARSVVGAKASKVPLASIGRVPQPWKPLDDRRKGSGPKSAPVKPKRKYVRRVKPIVDPGTDAFVDARMADQERQQQLVDEVRQRDEARKLMPHLDRMGLAFAELGNAIRNPDATLKTVAKAAEACGFRLHLKVSVSPAMRVESPDPHTGAVRIWQGVEPK